MAEKKKDKTGVTGGGEFSEGGGPGRTSETQGNRDALSGSGKTGRYSIDCAEAGEGCSLRISGTYDEVLSAGVEHGRSAHGMSGDDRKLRDELKGYIKEESGVPAGGMPGSSQGRGRSRSGASPRPS
jgi:predicted small metal-binding protein